MKNIFLYLIISLFSISQLSAQLDRSQRPQPGPAPSIQLGDFETFTLDNGLKVIVVENRQVPVVSFQLTLDVDPVLEGEAKGYVSMAGSMLREGTTNRSKGELDETIDFIGASISTSSTGIFASSLTRHQETLLDLMTDILYNPSFPETEFQRLITQSKSGLATVRNDANAMASNVATAVVYGPDHPYGEIVTEESLDNITLDMVKQYYREHFKPNFAYLVIVGDIDAAEAKALTTTYFAHWEPGDVPTRNWSVPDLPRGRKVALANRSGAIQSVVVVTHPVVLPPGHDDAIKVSVMNSILGGGVFSGRLMQNLREDKGYTYGARSNISNDRLVGRFTARTEVRNSVTDSTVTEILYEMERMINEPVEESSLQLVKNFMTGSFARSLESPRTIANFALNIERFGLPDDYYVTYLEKLNEVSVQDVQEMAGKYLHPDRSYIVVAGNKDEVTETLIPFSSDGEVHLYDPFGRPAELTAMGDVPEGITADDVIDAYIDALGGRSRLEAVKDMTQHMTASTMGMQIQLITRQKAPDLVLVKTQMGGMTLSQQLFDGEKGVVATQMGVQEFTEGPEFEQLKLQAVMNMELSYTQYGIDIALLGIERVDGQNTYKIALTMPSGMQVFDYYSVDTGLKVRTESNGSIARYSDYKETDGILFAHRIIQEAGGQIIEMALDKVEINQGLDKSIFTIN